MKFLENESSTKEQEIVACALQPKNCEKSMIDKKLKVQCTDTKEGA
jgi:hypothetical protein